jgi:hypothetical protein
MDHWSIGLYTLSYPVLAMLYHLHAFGFEVFAEFCVHVMHVGSSPYCCSKMRFHHIALP